MAMGAAIALLALVAAPLLASSHPDSKRFGCYNNLRQIGIAGQIWANDHADRLPWVTPVSEGGTRPNPGTKPAVAWVDLITLSNQLFSPRVFACPQDSATKVAANWSSGASGFANTIFRGNALSYFLSYHGEPVFPRSVVIGDRDLRPSSLGSPSTCGRAFVTGYATVNSQDFSVSWTNVVHARAGHFLFVDGSVAFIDNRHVLGALMDIKANVSPIHLIGPR